MGAGALANSMGPPDYGDVETLDVHREAALAVPDFPMPVDNYANVLRNLGRWEEALPVFRRAASLVGNGERISEEFRGQYVAAGDANAVELLGAYGDAAPKNEAAAGQGTPVYGSQYESAASYDRYLQYDIRAGDSDLRRYGQLLGYSSNGNKPLAAFLPTDSGALWAAVIALSRVQRAQALGGRSALASAVRANVPGLVHFMSMLPPKVARDQVRAVWPIVAVSMAKAGFAREGAQLLAPLPTDCYPCVVARGVTAPAPLGGSRRPSIRDLRSRSPMRHSDGCCSRRGTMLAPNARSTAIAIEPRFADAHAGLGDADAATGDWRGAASAYADAARYAPRWGKLHLRWAAALWNSGRRGDARAKLGAASAMDLSQTDRLLLTHLQAIAAR